MTDSFFSALRIVAVLIGSDRDISSREIRWFEALLIRSNVPHEKIMILREDMYKGTSIKELHAQIIDPKDRENLAMWARFAVHLDDKVHAREKAILKEIEELNHISSLPVEYSGLAQALIDAENENRIWRELAEVAEVFKKQIRRRGILGWPDPTFSLTRYPRLTKTVALLALIALALILWARWKR